MPVRFRDGPSAIPCGSHHARIGKPMKSIPFAVASALSSLLLAGLAPAQQLPDRDYQPAIAHPAFGAGDDDRPTLCLDEAHHNFHTLDNRFFAFGALARRDGYTVRASTAPFDAADTLAACDLLVISNAQPSGDEWDAYPYPTPSAFTASEIQAVRDWVEQGGQLLLIADHMPLAGAASALAAAFDVEFQDGFAMTTKGAENARAGRPGGEPPTLFRRADDTLAAHPITRGRAGLDEGVDQVRSFTGQAFRAPAHGTAILVLPADFSQLLPTVAWQFKPDTRLEAVGGWSQGAVLEVGKGRAAFFGEAAMFSAQVAGPERRPMGMNGPGAEQNHQLVLNVLHWLSGLL